MALRLPNLGDAPLSNKGPRGDLFIRLNVMPSSVFKRQGANLYYQARIPFHRALLGGIVRVPTLDGDVDVRIPGGTQQGEEMVLKGRGVSYLNSAGKGDLFVRFFLQLPRYVVDSFLLLSISLNLNYIQDFDQASANPPRGLC